MKIVAVFMLLAAVTHDSHASNVNNFKDDLVTTFVSRAAGDKIKDLLEKFKEIMRNGNETKGIPKLDPLSWNHKEISINDELLKAKGEVNNLYVEGLSDYIVDYAEFKFAKMNLSIALTWSRIKGDTLYDIIAAKIMDFIPIFGKGNATLEVENLKFSTNILINIQNKKLYLTQFVNTKISLHNLKLNAQGLYENEEFSEFLSAVISNIAPEGLNDLQEEIVTRVDNMMLEMGNEILKNFDFDDILGILKP
ncbi:uncharacterized protein LOC131670367 [Phymastichus coffea]|uniref:uncharacterized protein LOC131670367 n=1 Tax=Phymastichus coffea TaxID=108790 RepID=UPI00273B0A0E|nr:uncharacterized protein LOC131670367 [Phymastichus coffea]